MSKKENIKVIGFNFGHYEDAPISTILFGKVENDQKLTKKQAVDAFALDLYCTYLELGQEMGVNNPRCPLHGYITSTFKYCPECGSKADDATSNFNPYSFFQFLKELHSTTIEWYGAPEDYLMTQRQHVFPTLLSLEDLVGLKSNEYVSLTCDAQYVILGSLLKQKPELKSPSFSDWEYLEDKIANASY